MDKTNFLHKPKQTAWDLVRLWSTYRMVWVIELTLAVWSTLRNPVWERWYAPAGLPWWPQLWSFPSQTPQRWRHGGSAHHLYSHVKSHRAAGQRWNTTQRTDSRDVNTDSSIQIRQILIPCVNLLTEAFKRDHLPSCFWLSRWKHPLCSALFSQSPLLTEPARGHLGCQLIYWSSNKQKETNL